MFKTLKKIKNFIKESYQEGVEEAKAELAAEKAQESAQNEENRKRIAEIPHSELFALAIAAPFRAVYLSDWSPIFEDDKPDEEVILPYSLYSYGDADSLTETKRDELRKLLSRDFSVFDKDSAIRVSASILLASSISDKLAEQADEESALINSFRDYLKTEGHITPAWNALAACMAAYVISGSADCAYIKKDFASELLTDVSAFVRKEFSSWEEFGEEFLKGERKIKLNNALGRGFLKKYVGYLNNKQGSPWRTVPFEK